MSFRTEEKYLLGKQGNHLLCEDAIYVGKYFVAVVDGATSKSDFEFNDKKSGKIASELVVDAISNFSESIDIDSAIIQINSVIAKYYKNNGLYNHMESNKTDRFTACAAIYSDYRKEVWLIGDCQCMVNGIIHKNDKYIDEVLANTRALYLQLAIINGASVEGLLFKDIGRDYIMPLLIEQSTFQNYPDEMNPYTYSVFDGFPIVYKHVKRLEVKNSIVVLATDGYPKVCNDLQSSEFYLRDILQNDPLCMALYKSTKGMVKENLSYDDRAFIRIICS